MAIFWHKLPHFVHSLGIFTDIFGQGALGSAREECAALKNLLAAAQEKRFGPVTDDFGFAAKWVAAHAAHAAAAAAHDEEEDHKKVSEQPEKKKAQKDYELRRKELADRRTGARETERRRERRKQRAEFVCESPKK